MAEVKDSGHRRTFDTGAQRDRGGDKPAVHLISPFALKRLGSHYAAGARKYDSRNWEKGMPISECVASMCRHVEDFKAGEIDEDHLAAIAWNAIAIMHYQEMIRRGGLPAELDDMPDYSKVKEPG